jgi:hypothetical protein
MLPERTRLDLSDKHVIDVPCFLSLDLGAIATNIGRLSSRDLIADRVDAADRVDTASRARPLAVRAE